MDPRGTAQPPCVRDAAWELRAEAAARRLRAHLTSGAAGLSPLSVFPQNGDVKKQLHERQPRIAALSDKPVSELALPPAPRGVGRRARRHFGCTLKSAGLAPRAQTPKGARLQPAKLLALPPFSGEKEPGHGGLGGERGPGSGRKRGAALKAASPASILSWWTCFWNVRSLPAGVPHFRLCVRLGVGGSNWAWTPNYLKAISGFPCKPDSESFLRAPPPCHFSAPLFILGT